VYAEDARRLDAMRSQRRRIFEVDATGRLYSSDDGDGLRGVPVGDGADPSWQLFLDSDVDAAAAAAAGDVTARVRRVPAPAREHVSGLQSSHDASLHKALWFIKEHVRVGGIRTDCERFAVGVPADAALFTPHDAEAQAQVLGDVPRRHSFGAPAGSRGDAPRRRALSPRPTYVDKPSAFPALVKTAVDLSKVESTRRPLLSHTAPLLQGGRAPAAVAMCCAFAMLRRGVYHGADL
jgi:hypothetical protein